MTIYEREIGPSPSPLLKCPIDSKRLWQECVRLPLQSINQLTKYMPQITCIFFSWAWVVVVMICFFFFFADDGISIPCEYTSFLAPIAAPKLHFEVAQSNDSGKGPLVILHATLKTLRSRGVFSILCSIQFLWCSWGEFSSQAGCYLLMIVSDILMTLITYVVLNRLSAQPRISAHPLTT